MATNWKTAKYGSSQSSVDFLSALGTISEMVREDRESKEKYATNIVLQDRRLQSEALDRLETRKQALNLRMVDALIAEKKSVTSQVKTYEDAFTTAGYTLEDIQKIPTHHQTGDGVDIVKKTQNINKELALKGLETIENSNDLIASMSQSVSMEEDRLGQYKSAFAHLKNVETELATQSPGLFQAYRNVTKPGQDMSPTEAILSEFTIDPTEAKKVYTALSKSKSPFFKNILKDPNLQRMVDASMVLQQEKAIPLYTEVTKLQDAVLKSKQSARAEQLGEYDIALEATGLALNAHMSSATYRLSTMTFVDKEQAKTFMDNLKTAVGDIENSAGEAIFEEYANEISELAITPVADQPKKLANILTDIMNFSSQQGESAELARQLGDVLRGAGFLANMPNKEDQQKWIEHVNAIGGYVNKIADITRLKAETSLSFLPKSERDKLNVRKESGTGLEKLEALRLLPPSQGGIKGTELADMLTERDASEIDVDVSGFLATTGIGKDTTNIDGALDSLQQVVISSDDDTSLTGDSNFFDMLTETDVNQDTLVQGSLDSLLSNIKIDSLPSAPSDINMITSYVGDDQERLPLVQQQWDTDRMLQPNLEMQKYMKETDFSMPGSAQIPMVRNSLTGKLEPAENWLGESTVSNLKIGKEFPYTPFIPQDLDNSLKNIAKGADAITPEVANISYDEDARWYIGQGGLGRDLNQMFVLQAEKEKLSKMGPKTSTVTSGRRDKRIKQIDIDIARAEANIRETIGSYINPETGQIETGTHYVVPSEEYGSTSPLWQSADAQKEFLDVLSQDEGFYHGQYPDAYKKIYNKRMLADIRYSGSKQLGRHGLMVENLLGELSDEELLELLKGFAMYPQGLSDRENISYESYKAGMISQVQ